MGSHRPTGPRTSAQAVHACSPDRCGREAAHLLRPRNHRAPTKVPDDVRVFLSRRHPREKSPAYFMSTALTRSAQQALQGYRGRWSCEVVNFYLKNPIGLGRLSGALLPGDRQIYARRTPGLDLRRTTLRNRTLTPSQDLRRHPAAASGRTCGGLANRRFGYDAPDREPSTGLAALPASGTTHCLITLCPPERVTEPKSLLSLSSYHAPSLADQGVQLFMC